MLQDRVVADGPPDQAASILALETLTPIPGENKRLLE